MSATAPHVHGRLLPALDGLRAVAALLVVAFHVVPGVFPWDVGWTGVAVFFVLSGYLITRLSHADESGDGFSFRSFWIRRVTRIVPLYLLALAAYALLPFVGDGGGWSEVARTLPWYLTFNGEFVHHGPMTVAWSLGVEEKFYVVWPLVAFGVLAPWRHRLAFTALAASGCTVAAVVTGIGGLPGYAALLVGATLALLEADRGWVAAGAATPLSSPVAGWLVTVAVAGAVLGANLPGRQAVTYLVLCVAVAALVLHLVHGRSPVRTALSTRPMRWLGRRSYGIYLLHPLALTVAEKAVPVGVPGHAAVVGVGCLALTLVASDLAHRLVETPFIRLGRRWSDRWSDRQGRTTRTAWSQRSKGNDPRRAAEIPASSSTS